MVADRFDTLLRSLSETPSRRKALRLLAGSALGGLLTREAGHALAKKGGKGKGKGKNKGEERQVTLCHQGKTITVSSPRRRRTSPTAIPKAAVRPGPTVRPHLQRRHHERQRDRRRLRRDLSALRDRKDLRQPQRLRQRPV